MVMFRYGFDGRVHPVYQLWDDDVRVFASQGELLPNLGDGSLTEDVDAAAGTGLVGVVGTGDVSEQPDVSVGITTSVGYPTEDGDTSEGQGTVTILGSGAVSEQIDLSAGVFALLGSGAVTEQIDLSSGVLIGPVIDPRFLFEVGTTPGARLTFTAPVIRGTDTPFITISLRDFLSKMNSEDVVDGGLGNVAIFSCPVTCALETTSNPRYPDSITSTNLRGNSFINNPRSSVSQFFQEGVEGADYVLFFTFTLSNGETLTVDVILPVRKYT